MDPKDIRRIALHILKAAFRSWNGGGFNDKYWESPAGKRLVDTAEKVLDRAIKQETPGMSTCLQCWEITLGWPCQHCGWDWNAP